MCERCRAQRAATIPFLVTALQDSNSTGANLLGDLLQAAEYIDDGSINEIAGRIRVDEAMGQSYETNRRDALQLASWLIVVLHSIKTRIVEESINQRDTYAMSARWSDSENGFYITTTAGPDDAPVERFEPMLEGESRGQALTRIVNAHIQNNPHH